MIIDITYFSKGLLYLPNIVSSTNAGYDSSIDAQHKTLLEDAIVRHEQEYLERVLGVKLAEQFIVGLKADTIEQKWLDLKAKLTDEDNKRSPIANYVYVNYLKENETELVFRANASTPTAENSTIVSNFERIRLAWNDMVKLNIKLFTWLNEKADVYDLDCHFEDWCKLTEVQTYLG